jgi:hypothetical protein
MLATTTTNTPNRKINEVEFYLDIEFQCAYFNVCTEPLPGLNLFVTRPPESYQERNFEDRVIGELAFAGETSCHVFHTSPLKFTHLRKGTLVYQGVVEDPGEFGPFHHFIYTLNAQ